MLEINEVFKSIQGEGYSCGVPTVFVRLSGCSLSCPFCDSKYASRSLEDREYKVYESANSIKEFAEIVTSLAYKGSRPVKLIVFTGGEPLLNKNLDVLIPLVIYLCNVKGFQVDFETTLVDNIEDIVSRKITFMDRLEKIVESFVTFDNKVSLGSGLYLPKSWDKTTSKVELFNGDLVFSRERQPYVGVFVISPKFDLRSYQSKVTIDDILTYYVNGFDNRPERLSLLIPIARFKLLYNQELESVIIEFINRLKNFVPDRLVQELVQIMPLVDIDDYTDEKYKIACKQTAEFCIENSLSYSPRIHFDIWGYHKRKV